MLTGGLIVGAVIVVVVGWGIWSKRFPAKAAALKLKIYGKIFWNPIIRTYITVALASYMFAIPGLKETIMLIRGQSTENAER